jgi:hypothetical protein
LYFKRNDNLSKEIINDSLFLDLKRRFQSKTVFRTFFIGPNLC